MIVVDVEKGKDDSGGVERGASDGTATFFFCWLL
jgi:hypothetical protein